MIVINSTLYHLPVNFFPSMGVFTFILGAWYRGMISWVLNRSTQLKILLFWNILMVTKSQFSRKHLVGSWWATWDWKTGALPCFHQGGSMDLLLEVDQISNAKGMFNQDLRPWGLARGKWVWAGEVLEGSVEVHRYKYHPQGEYSSSLLLLSFGSLFNTEPLN
jgi:hypothetical protein